MNGAIGEPRGSASASQPPSGDPQPAALAAARAVLDSLIGMGVRHVILAPGSRSAPFVPVLAAAEAEGLIRVRVVLDERSAGFIAVGLARAEMRRRGPRPAAVITTSGTAVANLHPAVVEADAAGVPLLLVTADRPHELVGTGASQTTEQTRLFGGATRAVVDLPADLVRDLGPAAADLAIGGRVRSAVEAARGRLSRDPGPAQINVRFRPPLAGALVERAVARPVPAPAAAPSPAGSTIPAALAAPPGSARPVAPAVPAAGPPPATREPRGGARGLVVVGDTADRLGDLGRALAEHLDWPLLAEPTSGARGGPQALVRYAELLAAPAGAELSARAQRVLVLGRPGLTRAVTALLSRRDLSIDVLTSTARWTDVAGTAAAVHPVDPREQDVAGLAAALGLESAPPSWMAAWREAVDRLPALPEDGEALTPDSAALAVYAACSAPPAGAAPAEAVPDLVLGSSMTIRRLDRLAPPTAGPAPAPIANRGLAGIDGTLATALGVALAQERGGAGVRAVVGDLTFLHDAMSLGRGRCEAEPDLQVVVVDDAGGAIFSTLEYPAVTAPEVLDRYFTTPQGADVAALARALGARVHGPRTASELRHVLAGPVRGLSVVHVRADDRSRQARPA